jgi:hypothetical protein
VACQFITLLSLDFSNYIGASGPRI